MKCGVLSTDNMERTAAYRIKNIEIQLIQTEKYSVQITQNKVKITERLVLSTYIIKTEEIINIIIRERPTEHRKQKEKHIGLR